VLLGDPQERADMTTQTSQVIHNLRGVLLLREGADLTDGQLLEDFVIRREPLALEALVRRHGPMVWGVCCRVLGNRHDAEDAFQATFLVLVRRAASINPKEMVGNWLFGVARRTSLKARAMTAKRLAREMSVADLPEPTLEEHGFSNDMKTVIDQELSRLPEKYRAAIVMCDLRGETRKEAARQLGLPEGTLAGRLTRGRAMLAKRLGRYGLTASGLTLAAMLAQNVASASPPVSVVSSTIKTARLLAVGKAAAGVLSSQVAALTEGVLRTMLVTKLKNATAVLLAVGVLGTALGAGGWFWRTQAAEKPTAAQNTPTPPKEEPKAKPPVQEGRIPPDDPLQAARDRALVEEQRQTVIVDADLRKAKDIFSKAPDEALKLIRDNVVQVLDNPDISERVRDDLLNRLLTARRDLRREEGEEDKKGWQLDFKFKNPRLVTVDVPGQGRKTFWYLWYDVVNNTGEPHTFVPDFELVIGDKVHRDVVLPKIQEAIRRLEDPDRDFDVKNSVTIAAQPIPPLKRGAVKKAEAGVAIWVGVDPAPKCFTVFVSGLSSSWSRAAGQAVRRQVLKINFKRADDEILPTGPAE